MKFDMLHIILLHFFIICMLWRALFSANGDVGGGDMQALLSFKAHIVDDPFGFLVSWNASSSSSSSHFCNSWFGVNCSLPHQRVMAIDLYDSQLRGTLSPSIGNLTFVQVLDLSGNSFSGTIPQEITQLTHLRYLDLSQNSFSGTIPQEISQLTQLRALDLSSNSLTGEIPSNLTSLLEMFLNLEYNQLTGTIPAEIGSLPNLNQLDFRNNHLSGTIPPSFGNLSALRVLSLSHNNLAGVIPQELGNLPNLTDLDLFANQLTGAFPMKLLHNITTLDAISLGSNNFNGSIPSDFGLYLPNLNYFSVQNNQLTGPIPASITNASLLQYLGLYENSFSGSIPQEISQLTSLLDLYLGDNVFTGEIPSSIGNLSLLFNLKMRGNKFSGGIPASLGNCTKLRHLDLSNNMLTEAIPRTIFSLTSLVSLSFACNNLSGYLPVEIGKMIMLTFFDVSHNNLSGKLPFLLGSCFSLETFNAQSNHFIGSIPPALDQIKFIQLLDLSNNNFTGKIPAEFTSFASIQFLNLSSNHLDGEVPDQGLFSNSTAFSIVRNGNLCGGIKSLHLPQCPSKQKLKHTFTMAVVLPAIIIVSFMSIAYICFFYHRSRTSTSLSIREPMNSPLGERYPKLSYAQLLQATDRFSSDNLIGTGRYSWVYKGVLTQFEQCIAIKVIKLDQSGAKRSFVAECEALKYIRHRNLVKIITACSGTDYQRNEFKALVYEFMSNGNLDSWLHPISTESTGLNLIQRLSISIDVASVLVYLHHGCEIPILHRDIKPSNVLLDDDFCAHLGDFGSARSLLNPIDRTSGGRIHPTANEIVGTVGYVALEYAVGAPASTLVDVYSYGILLLEMFTGKRPTDTMFKDEFSLHSYVKMAIPDQVMSIADPRLFAECENNPFRTSGEARRRNDCEIEKCLASVFRVGVICCAQSPKERMEIADALVILETVRDTLSKLLY